MPIYAFQCPKCKIIEETIFSFHHFISIDESEDIGVCKCGQKIYKKNQVINFQGCINMNSSSVGVANRKYSNKAGGPKPVIDDKVRNDLKMKS